MKCERSENAAFVWSVFDLNFFQIAYFMDARLYRHFLPSDLVYFMVSSSLLNVRYLARYVTN